MQKPVRYVLKKRSGYRTGLAVLVVVLLVLAFVVGLASLEGAQPDELALPVLVLGGMGLFVVVALLGLTALSVIWERRAIGRLLTGELWAQWQYAPDEWKRIASNHLEAEGSMYKPGYNLIIGPVLGAIIAGIALYIKDPQMTPIMLLIAGIVTVGVIVTGLVLIVVLRSNRQARYRRRLRVESPRLYIGPYAMYHETDGYTSLARLGGVEYVPGDSTIVFRVYERLERYGSFRIPVNVEVPRGREADAEALVERFNHQRVADMGWWRPFL